MSALTEQNIIDTIYSLYETDDAGWDTTSSEYVTARAYCNAAINDWASRETWRDLRTTLTAASDGDKTTTAGDYTYSCPTNFSYICSWVRTVDGSGGVSFWEVIPNEMIAKYSNSEGKYCFITGSVKDGFTLNFNAKETLTTGHTINYEYYKTPTLYSGTTTTSEIPDPYYCVYYALARLLKNDGEDFSYEEAKARDIMDQMLTRNMKGYWDINNPIEETLALGTGFGT